MKKEENKVIDIAPLLKERNRKNKVLSEENEKTEVIKLYEIADIIVGLSILLDEVGQHKYADKISSLMEEMFTDKEITPEDWGWKKD